MNLLENYDHLIRMLDDRGIPLDHKVGRNEIRELVKRHSELYHQLLESIKKTKATATQKDVPVLTD